MICPSRDRFMFLNDMALISSAESYQNRILQSEKPTRPFSLCVILLFPSDISRSGLYTRRDALMSLFSVRAERG